MQVVLLLALIWAAVLVPPAVRAHAERRDAFLVSFGPAPPSPAPRAAPRPYSQRVQARRRIAGGLLMAMVATLLIGLLPTFRVFLVVHLFLVDSFLGYVAVLAHMANRAARARSVEKVVEEAPATPADAPRRRRRPRVPRPVLLGELGQVAPAG